MTAERDYLTDVLLFHAIHRGAAAIARAEESLQGLRRNQEARLREYGNQLIRIERQALKQKANS